MSATRSVVRSIRVDKDIDSQLQRDAEENGTSVNSLVSSILIRYVEWDRYAGNFGYTCLPSELLKSFIDSIDDEKLFEISRRLGKRLLREGMQFWFKRVDTKALVRSIVLLCKYSGIGKYDMRSEEKKDTIIIQHRWGPKWSEFMRILIDETIQSLKGITAEFETSENQLVITLA